jgi:hypothetical protein
MAHEVNDLGYPLDPELRHWQKMLGNLAAEWRAVYRGIDKQDEIVAEYHAILKKMYDKGWRSYLDVDSELPDSLMPDFYLNMYKK